MYKIHGGWTKARMIELVKKYVPKVGRCTDGPGGRCMYRNPQSNERCAVGAFLPDNHPAILDPSGVNLLVMDLMAEYPFDAPIDVDGLRTLQLMHDYESINYPDSSSQDICVKWIEEHVEE